MANKEGIEAFLADVNQRVRQAEEQGRNTNDFVGEIGEHYAFIRLHDLNRPRQFLRQLAGEPPLQFGTTGFRRELVDDKNPARHYIAFVFVGYWLPLLLAIPVLWAWVVLGFVRYRGHWSQPDIRNGYIGLYHGRQVRRHGAAILPELIARDLDGRGNELGD